MDYKYSLMFTELADKQLDDILYYIQNDLSNPKAATDLGRKIFSTLDNVRNFPQSGTIYDNVFVTDKTVRWIAVDNYTVYYKVDEDNKQIIVICVIYSKRNIPEILNKI